MKRLAFALLLVAGSATAGPLEDAQRKIDDIDYEGARELVAKTLDAGGLSSTDLVRAHRMAGEVAAALGDAAGAEEHFLAWLVLDPTAKLDEGVSPRIAEPFAAAEARATQLGAFDPEITVERIDARALVTLGGKDPLQMIAGMKVEIDGGGTEETRDLSIELSVPDRAADVTVTVLDARGNVLAVRTATVEGVVRGGGGSSSAETTGGGRSGGLPAAVRWPTWTVLTAVSAGVGGYFTWQLGNDQDELTAINAEPAQHSFDEAEAARDRGDRHALYANIAFGVAGAAAIAAVLTYVLEPDGDVEVAPTASPTGGGMSATIKF